MTHPKMFLTTADEIRSFRRKLGMNQGVFWSRIGITQSGGSRYEAGDRKIPRTIQLLLHVAYAPDTRAHRVVGMLRNWKMGASDSESA